MFSSHLRLAFAAVFAFAAAPLFPLRAVEDEVAAKERVAAGEAAPTKGSQMIYGPVLTCGVEAPGPKESRQVAVKGLVIKLRAADGAEIQTVIGSTINKVP